MEATAVAKLPRENLIRALAPGFELRAADDEDAMPTLRGHFAVFNRWTEIDSLFEGHFMERIAEGAFSKTFTEQRAEMRVLFQHGMDPVVGDKPLGPIEELAQDEVGAAYEVPLLDTTYNRDLIPGLEAGLYGASFRFRVMREEIEQEPESSDENPEGLPERTIKEAQVFEFGPVTFPAYQEATAGVRSLRPADLHIALAEKELEAAQERLSRHLPDEDVPQPHDGAEPVSPRQGLRRRFLRRAKYQIPTRGKEDPPPWQIP